MVQKTALFIDKYKMIKEHDLVAVGVSGGADSLCLLFVLLEYRKKVPFELVVVHVNHMIREDADKDEAFVKEICLREGVPFYSKKEDVKKLAKEKHQSEEEAGRNIRYKAFREALELYNEDGKKTGKIAVAHHQSDLAETMLFHLFRGTGIYGMAGILPVNGNIIRPLLNCSRNEIEEFLKKRGERWCIDYTNEEDTYTRNKIRHHILGYADQQINEKSTEHVAQAAMQIASLREYLEEEVAKMKVVLTKKGYDEVSIDTDGLKTYPEFLQSQFLLSMIDTMVPGRKDVGLEHVRGIMNLLSKNGTKRLNLPGNLEVIKEYNDLWIRRKKSPKSEEKEPKEQIILKKENEDFGQEFDGNILKRHLLKDGSVMELSFADPAKLEQIEENKYTKYFDYDKINSCLSVRFRQTGDYITFNDKGQRKTLKEYFIQEKIPVSMRGEIPLIADGDHILWIVGYRISAHYKVTAETKKIVQMTIRREEHVREN